VTQAIEVVDLELPGDAEGLVWCAWCGRAIEPERYLRADGDVVLVVVHDDVWHPEDYPGEPS